MLHFPPSWQGVTVPENESGADSENYDVFDREFSSGLDLGGGSRPYLHSTWLSVGIEIGDSSRRLECGSCLHASGGTCLHNRARTGSYLVDR